MPCDATQGEKQSKTVTITFKLVLVRHNNGTVTLCHNSLVYFHFDNQLRDNNIIFNYKFIIVIYNIKLLKYN